MKRLLFSDLHFHPHEPYAVVINGENSRLLDSISVLNQIKAYALTNGITEIDCLGDFFHTRKKIDIGVYDLAYTILEDFKQSGLNLNLLAGNHDIYYRNSTQVTSLRPLSKFAHIINFPEIQIYDGYKFAYLPYYEKPEQLAKIVKAFPVDVYFIHAEYLGAQKASSSKDVAKHGITLDIFPPDFKFVFMGHYHKYQVIPNTNDRVMYLGSPIQITKREITENKFIYELDTVTLKLTQIALPTPKFCVVEFPSQKIIKYWDMAASLPDAVKGNYVEVITTDVITKTSAFYKILQTARNFLIINKSDKKSKLAKSTVTVALDDLDVVTLSDLYMTEHPHESLSKEFLLNVRDKIISQ